MKKIIIIIILITLVAFLAIIIKLLDFASKSSIKDVKIQQNATLTKEDSIIFNTNRKDLSVLTSIKSKGRHNIQILKKNDYYIYYSKFLISPNFTVDSIKINPNQNPVNTILKSYYNLELPNGRYSINIDSLNTAKSLEIVGKFKENFVVKRAKETTLFLSETKNIGIKVGENNPLNFQHKGNSFKSLYSGIIFHKEKNILTIIYISSNKKFDENDIRKNILNNNWVY